MGATTITASKRCFLTIAAAGALVIAPAAAPFNPAALIPTASAACPDVEVVFARGREEPPGAGQIGDALANSLRAQTQQSVGVYGVNYPADVDTIDHSLKQRMASNSLRGDRDAFLAYGAECAV